MQSTPSGASSASSRGSSARFCPRPRRCSRCHVVGPPPTPSRTSSSARAAVAARLVEQAETHVRGEPRRHALGGLGDGLAAPHEDRRRHSGEGETAASPAPIVPPPAIAARAGRLPCRHALSIVDGWSRGRASDGRRRAAGRCAAAAGSRRARCAACSTCSTPTWPRTRERLVVYGGRGRAARSWADVDAHRRRARAARRRRDAARAVGPAGARRCRRIPTPRAC